MRGYQIFYNQGIITLCKAKEMLITEVKKSGKLIVSYKQSRMYLSGIHQTWKRFSLWILQMDSMWGVKYWGFLHILEILLRLLRFAALRSNRGDPIYLVF